MPIPDTTNVGELIRFFKKDKPEASHEQIVAIAFNVAKKNKEKEMQKKAFNYEGEDEGPQTGPEAILYALKNTKIEDLEKRAKEDLASGKKTKRNGAVALLNIVKGMKRNNQEPADYMIKSVPVIPTKYRPFSAQGGTFIPGDANVLYKDLFDIRDAHNEELKMFGPAFSGQSRLDLYDAVKSVYGYGDPVKAKTKAKDVKGFLQKITGTTSKFGFVNRKLLSKTQDNTGRSTIIVEPDYGIDEIGLPEPMAFKMYAPYIQRRLKMTGMRDADALRHVREQTKEAKMALEREMQERPVIYSRAPAWHDKSFLAAKPKLVNGAAIHTNPYVAAGLGADYDGDQQIGSILCCFKINALQGLDDSMTEIIKNSSLLLPCPEVKYSCHSKISAMYKNTKITTKGTTGWVSLDLSDFPHGSLINVNKKNGYDIEFYSVPEGTLVPAYDENSGEIVAAEVSAWSIHRGREVEIVTLADGSQIFTDNDPRAVYGIGKNASTLIPTRWTPTEALRENVVVPMDPETIPEIVSEKQYYDMLTNELCQERRNSFTIKLDYDFGQVVGCLCGDGWVSEGNFTPRTHISDKEYDNAIFILEYFRRTVLPGCTMCSVEVKNRKNKYGTSITHTYYHKNKGVVSLAMKNLIGGESCDGTSGALNKHLPTWYTVANKDFLRGLVNGLVATDGTISVVKAADKNKPQLMIAVTSVSLRMLREAKRALAMLGVPSTISKSKITTADNISWCLTISCPQAKKQNLFANCCMKRKAKTFTDTEVSTEAVAIKLDYVPFPECVSSAIVPNFKAIKVSKKYKEQHPELTEEQWAARVNQSGFACELRADSARGYITRAKAKNILAKLENIDNERLKAYDNGKLILAEPRTDAKGKFILDGTTRDALRTALDALIPSMSKDKADERDKAKELLSKAVRKSHVREEAYRAVDALFSTCEFFFIKDTDLILDWKRLINSTIKWMPVTQVEKTGKTETGYDLTVPGYETFMNSDGVILSNTINVHVPSSPAAVKEAYEVMMASKTPFSDRSEGKLVPLPKQEQVLGLYTAATAPTTQTFDFPSEQDAIAAIRQGKVPLSADVTIRGKSL